MNLTKVYHFLFIGLFLISSRTVLSQAPQKTFTEKLDGIQTSSKELTKSASTDNSSVGQSGVMSTSVPLVTVTSRTMNFPIQLNYASGIKVDQQSGPVGLGWALPVGSITRDYGAFEPDYTSTSHEGDMLNSNPNGQTGWLNPNGGSSAIHPDEYSTYLGYDALVAQSQRQTTLSDFYHLTIPGKASNTFWNQGPINSPHNWTWTEYENWRVSHQEKLFVISQEFSRINDANLDNYGGAGKDWFPMDQSYAAAIGILPYVIDGYAIKPTVGSTSFNPYENDKKVKYEDFGSFTITDDNGTRYVFGRPLRGQKFIFQDDPYWTVMDNGNTNASDGSFWKTDFIAEWLLTEILSADYVDLNGNGFADNGDAGDWIRFEYTEPTKTIGTVPYGELASNRLPLEVPTHREWSSFSQTDQASSLMRERAYLTKIITPIQELDFTISQRFDVDHDYYSKPANKIGNVDFFYEDRQYGSQGTSSDFDVNYPVETMKYDSIKVYSRLIDKNVYQDENTLTGAIVLNYADKGSPEELAVSEYLIRNNANEDKGIDKPSSSHPFDITNYSDGITKRGKTTLLSIDFFDDKLTNNTKTSFEFEYGYNPSYNEIHKRKIVRAYSFPSLRNSASSSDYSKSKALISYQEQRLNADGLTYTNVSHTGTPPNPQTIPPSLCNLRPNEFLIDIPYVENEYKLSFSSNAAIQFYASSASTGAQGHQINPHPLHHPLAPIKDVYGFLYAENCSICPEAWSLTKITYPTGGEVSFEYEQGEFDKATDEPNWNVSENEIPFVKEYNELAKERSYVQDAYNRYADIVGSDGFGQDNDQYKTLTPTFEVELPSAYGIRLKKKVMNDRINVPVEINYSYGNGHFTSAPAEYVQSYLSAFNQFILRENARHSWEVGNYGPAPGTSQGEVFTSDYINRMSHAAITDLALDEYQAIHFYEMVDEVLIDNSKIRTHYGPLDGINVAEYMSYNVFCYRLPGTGFGWDGGFILAREDLDVLPIMPLKTEKFDANDQTPYQVEINTYERETIITYPLAFDYTNGTSNPNSVNMWGLLDYYNIWLPVTQVFTGQNHIFGNGLTITFPGGQTGITGFGMIQSQITSSFSLPYNGVQTFEYDRWGSFKTKLVKSVTNYKGLESTTEYTYNNNHQLATQKVFGSNTSDQYLTEYKYAYETYGSIFPNLILSKNMLALKTEVNTYLTSVAPYTTDPINTVSANFTTYDLTNYEAPRIENMYVYESDLDPTFGTFTLSYFDINSSTNPNWRIAQNDQIDYNKPGQLISNRSNRLYSKTVFGNNINLPKATISHTYEAFDATYSGFEDFNGRHDIDNWNNQDYKDEDWFTESETVLLNTWVTPTPSSNSICPNGIGWANFDHVVSFQDISQVNIGDQVVIHLEYDNTTYDYPVTIESFHDNQLLGPNVTSFDHLVCFEEIVDFPFNDPLTNDGTPVFTSLISEANVVNYNLSRSYSRTGEYSYKLPTIKSTEETPNKTAIRPVKLSSPPPPSNCITNPSTSETSDECKFVYEASVWLKYDSDIPSIGNGDGVGPKSADIQGDAIYQRGTVSQTNNQQGVKIIFDVYNSDRTSLESSEIFYVDDLSSDWKQYTVDINIERDNKWLDIYVQNERSQIGASVPAFKSVFVDDIIIYPAGSKYSYKTYDKFGNETFITNNNDVFIESVFDDKGRPILQKNAYGNMVSEQEYFEHPNWSSQVNHVTERTWVSNGIYNESRYYLDGFGKTKQAMVADHARNARIVTESNYFNDKGFPTATFKPYALIGSTLGDNYDTDFIFNVQDLYSSSQALTEVTYEAKPEMKVSTMSPPYENNETPIITSQQDYVSVSSIYAPYGQTPSTQNYPVGSLLIHEVTDANGNIIKTYMDNLGRVILEEHPIGEDHIQNADGTITMTTGNVIAQTWFVYDPEGRLIKVVDPTGMQSTYKYNSLGVVVKKTTPDKGTSELRYDKYGQIRFVRDQKDINATNSNSFNTDQFSYWKYDEWGRVVETGQKQAAPSSPPFTGQLLFDDYTKIEDQDFPLLTDPLVELHQRFEYDGSRDQFNSEATLCETVYHDHLVNGNLTITAQTVDEKCYEYMADGQVAIVTYNYQGLDEHTISYTYNDVRIPIGKKYSHPTESGYDFEWRTNLDNFARPRTNVSTWNGVETQTGKYYYDVLGNLLMKGLGSTGNSTNPHLDYHYFKFDIRDQLTHNVSKNFRFGLKHDVQGNITDQFWSNEFFDPTDGTTIDINQYHYYYDEMNRLIGADYRLGAMTENPFDNFDNLFGSIPNDFLCGVNNIAVDEYMEPFFAELEQSVEDGENPAQSTEALNSLNILKVEYKRMDIAYSQMTETENETFFNTYINEMLHGNIDPKAYELYRADQEGDTEHIEFVYNEDIPMSFVKMKYTQILMSGIPYNASVQCDANENATVYGFLPTFPFPTNVTNSTKYDAAYWYTENGNLTDLNRNDQIGVKTEQDYSYNSVNNQLDDVDWSQQGVTPESHTMSYDANGNILNETFVGPLPQNPISLGSPQGSFTYDDYDELPTSISTGNGTRNYRYDVNGQRIVKEVDANDKNYYLDGVIIDQNNEVVSYQTPEGYVSVSNNGGIVADYFYNVTDWLGTNRAIMDATGNIVNAHDHYPFGKRMPARHMVTDAEGNRYQYTGHEFDEETGYGYHGARYYNRELGRYMNVDRYAEKFYGQSPYVYAGDMPIVAVDVNGDSIEVTNSGGEYLFTLDDGKTDLLTMTAKQVYDKGYQWFEPEADNYVPLLHKNDELSKNSSLKHFEWHQIASFAIKSRYDYSFRSGGSGDWKSSPEGANGYFLITVGGDPYWADAVGQIPFAVDMFKDAFEDWGDENDAIKYAVEKGQEYGDGKIIGGTSDYSNSYDNYFVLRGALWASDKYTLDSVGAINDYSIKSTKKGDYNLLKKPIKPADAIIYR